MLSALRFYGIAVRGPGLFVADPIANFWRRVDRSEGSDGCWWWLGAPKSERHGDRYGLYTTRGVQRRAHVYSYEITKGSVPTGMFVCHTCDHPRCVNPAHLVAETPRWNTQDCIRKGRRGALRGEARSGAKLTDGAVREIWLAIFREEASFAELARRFGVSIGAVQRIRERRTWRHVTNGLPAIPSLPPIHPTTRRAARSAA